MVKFEEITYKNLGKCIKMTNGETELIVSVDVGPRIVSYSFCGGENVFGELPADFKKPTANGYEIYGDLGVFNNFGGHRLWVSPEMKVRTSFPDNHPCKYEINGETLTVIQNVQPVNMVQIKMEISFQWNMVKVLHTVTNCGMWDIKIAPWSISVMAKEGTLVLPMQKEGPRLLPNRNFSFWTYSDLGDKRFELTNDYVLLHQSPDAKKAFKFGMGNKSGKAAYVRGNVAFIKYFDFIEGAEYPDFGCNFESYTDKNILEVESVAPLKTLKQGESTSHTEYWNLKNAQLNDLGGIFQ